MAACDEQEIPPQTGEGDQADSPLERQSAVDAGQIPPPPGSEQPSDQARRPAPRRTLQARGEEGAREGRDREDTGATPAGATGVDRRLIEEWQAAGRRS